MSFETDYTAREVAQYTPQEGYGLNDQAHGLMQPASRPRDYAGSGQGQQYLDLPEVAPHGGTARSNAAAQSDSRGAGRDHGDDHTHARVHTHKVQKGEILSEIALKHLGKGHSVHDLYNYVNMIGRYNHLPNVDKIHPGQTIRLPEFRKPVGRPDAEHAILPPVRPPELKASENPGKQEVPAQAKDKSDAPAAVTETKPDAPAVVPATKPDAPAVETHTGDIENAPVNPVVPPPAALNPPLERPTVIGAITGGIVDEAANHTGDLLWNGALGAGTGLLGAGAVAARMVSARALGLGALAVGAAAGAYTLYEHGKEWWNAAGVLNNPDNYSPYQQQRSQDVLHGLGRGIADTGAGMAGGMLSGFGASRMLSGFAPSAVDGAIGGVARSATPGAAEAAVGVPVSDATVTASRLAAAGSETALRPVTLGPAAVTGRFVTPMQARVKPFAPSDAIPMPAPAEVKALPAPTPRFEEMPPGTVIADGPLKGAKPSRMLKENDGTVIAENPDGLFGNGSPVRAKVLPNGRLIVTVRAAR